MEPANQSLSAEVNRRAPSGRATLQCRAHGELVEWLFASGGSLAITTYTSGKLLLASCFEEQLRWRVRRFPRPMGLAVEGRRLALAVQNRLLLYRNSREKTERRRERFGPEASDAVFVPDETFTTGKVDAHDVAFGRRRLYFANTRYNCLGRPSRKSRFSCCWLPPFISQIAPHDRCHLNGLGMRDGRPAMVTAFCDSERPGGWREEDRFSSGVVIDVSQNQTVVGGLCMPHSPRWHAGRWWLCNSGEGTLGTFDPESGRYEVVCSLPGFTRGLFFVGNYALVGLSRVRRRHVLDAPPVRAAHRQLIAGVAVVDWRTGQQLGLLEFVRGGNEVYDVAFLTGVRRPDLIVPSEV